MLAVETLALVVPFQASGFVADGVDVSVVNLMCGWFLGVFGFSRISLCLECFVFLPCS